MRPAIGVALLTVLLSTTSAAKPALQDASVPKLDHVVVVVFENKEADAILGDRRAPTFNRLARDNALLANYTGVTHPSLPNYLALVSGSTHGIHTDCMKCIVGGRSLADTLPAKRRSWKVYAENLPHGGYVGRSKGRYAKNHVPFAYFRHVRSNRRRAANIVPLRQLKRDLSRRDLPSFSLVVPDRCHDMHDCSIAIGDLWLSRFLPPLLQSPALGNGAVFVIFDEGETNKGGGGRVAAIALGPAVRPATRDDEAANHYALLRTVEDTFGLTHLGHSKHASPITGIWR